MRDILARIIAWFRGLFYPAWQAEPVPHFIDIPVEIPPPQSGPAIDEDPRLAATGQLFDAPQSETHDVHIRDIDGEGRIEEKSEHWLRGPDGALRNHNIRTKVRSCSGKILNVDEIGSICAVCGGFEGGCQRCDRCQSAICALHQRRLESQTYCPNCFSISLYFQNTWRNDGGSS